jgi:hypothetical protein
MKINEVDPRNYDSDIDYYNALNAKPKQRTVGEPRLSPAQQDAEDEDAISQQRQAAAAKARKERETTWDNKEEGSAPNGQQYNSVYTINAPSTYSAEGEAYSFKDYHWGAKKVVDQEYKALDDGRVELKLYVVDNHKYGLWRPWKDSPVYKEGVSEAKEDAFMSKLGGLKSWQVVIFNNYYAGKYSDYRGKYYTVLASSAEQARQVVLDNADAILQDLLALKDRNGRKTLPRGSAVRITPDRIGKIEDGTVAGRMSTTSYKKMYSPQGVMMVKLSNGAIVDVQGQEQGVAEAEKNPHTSALGKALYRDLSKEKKASPQQVQRNKERWAKRQAEREQGVAENYPKHQDLSGVSTDKLKAYLARQSQQSVPGEGSQVKRVQAELQRRSQGVAEGYDDEEHPIRDDGNEGRPGKQYQCPRCHSTDIKTYSDGEKECHQCHKTWDVKGVAEGSRDQVDTNTVWEVCFDYGPHQSDKVKVRASSQKEAEQNGMRAAKKLGHKFPQLNWAMPAEQDIEEEKKKRFDDWVKASQEKRKQQEKQQGVVEGAGNISNSIKALYQKIYDAGDDEIEYFYNDSPIFAQYWDEYEGDLDSIIAEVDPAELQIMHDELESYVQQANLAEGFKNSYSVGDRVDSPMGTGTIVALSKNIDIDDKVKVKLDDPSKAGEDGKYKDTFVLTTAMLKHLPEESAKAKNPYAIGMAQAMKSTGDKPPLEKATIRKAHEIAKRVMKQD